MKKYFFFLLSLFAATSIPAADTILKNKSGQPFHFGGKFNTAPVRLPSYRQPRAEMRGVWVATVENIDFATHADAGSFCRDFSRLCGELAKRRFNAVFFQVRANNDAFYPSQINPWSRWLTGQEGRGIPRFDPLRYMVEEAHRHGLEFHAWLNPYRVIGRTPMSKAAYLKTLDPRNFARKHPELVLAAPLDKGERLLFLNPGEPAVVRHILDTVAEIATHYPVDSIHFDDYFYPYTDIGSIDAATEKKYNTSRLSTAQWRRGNTDRLISGVKARLNTISRQTGRTIRFGISPFGIWANRKSLAAGSPTGGKESYFTQYADTRGWVKKRYIDYIVPQLYWTFGHSTAAYAGLADWWAAQTAGTGVDLYIGMAIYRAGGGGDWNDPMELANQLRFNSGYPEIKGSVFFSARRLLQPDNPTMKKAANQIAAMWSSRVPVRTAGNKVYPRFR